MYVPVNNLTFTSALFTSMLFPQKQIGKKRLKTKYRNIGKNNG
jgi:hypothetical protein